MRQGRTTDVAIDIKKIDIQACLEHLGKQGYTSVLVEGGSTIISSFVEALAFDKIVNYIGNLVIGGTNSTSAFYCAINQSNGELVGYIGGSSTLPGSYAVNFGYLCIAVK